MIRAVALNSPCATQHTHTHTHTRTLKHAPHMHAQVLRRTLRRPHGPAARASPVKPHAATLNLPPHLAGFRGPFGAASYAVAAAAAAAVQSPTSSPPRYAAATAASAARAGISGILAKSSLSPVRTSPGRSPAPPHTQSVDGSATITTITVAAHSTDGAVAATLGSACTTPTEATAISTPDAPSSVVSPGGETIASLVQVGCLCGCARACVSGERRL